MAADQYDMACRGGYLVDPVNGIDKPMDIGIRNGRIAEVSPRIDSERARSVMDMTGKTLVPGIIDSHVHLSGLFSGDQGFKMVAADGVVTAIDFAGDRAELEAAVGRGAACGLNVGFLRPALPGKTIDSEAPAAAEQDRFIQETRDQGGLGIKLLSGAYPLTPAAFSRMVHRAARFDMLVAAHAGTTATRSDLNGLLEAAELADGAPLYIAHLNSYCFGMTGKHPVEEAVEAIRCVQDNPNITAESYIARINGTDARCTAGAPESKVTCLCLNELGFDATEEGLAEAIGKKCALVHCANEDGISLITGDEGLQYWQDNGTRTGVSFKINSIAAASALATWRDNAGKLVVDILSTDGGLIPRNNLVKNALALWRLGGLSLTELVMKTSATPAKTFGLDGKGHLGVGADADITVLDTTLAKASMSLAAGEVLMRDGEVPGCGGKLILGH